MSIRPAQAIAETSGALALEIDVRGRWDALALSELLVPFHSFLVQYTVDRWVVHARVPGCRGERLADALRVIGEWRVERGIDAPVRIGAHASPTGMSGRSADADKRWTFA
jgi:hypothetical protein